MESSGSAESRDSDDSQQQQNCCYFLVEDGLKLLQIQLLFVL